MTPALTLRQVAERTQMSPATVRAWVRDLPPERRLPSRRIGPTGQYRIELVDLEKWLEHR